MRKVKKRKNLLNRCVTFESSSEDFKNKTWFKTLLSVITWFAIFNIFCHIVLGLMAL
jgi:hypothetical protein